MDVCGHGFHGSLTLVDIEIEVRKCPCGIVASAAPLARGGNIDKTKMCCPSFSFKQWRQHVARTATAEDDVKGFMNFVGRTLKATNLRFVALARSAPTVPRSLRAPSRSTRPCCSGQTGMFEPSPRGRRAKAHQSPWLSKAGEVQNQGVVLSDLGGGYFAIQLFDFTSGCREPVPLSG